MYMYMYMYVSLTMSFLLYNISLAFEGLGLKNNVEITIFIIVNKFCEIVNSVVLVHLEYFA